ncbi:MAG: HEAT repeat domain-containing protein, partial [Gemmatimonadota bacterium]|nr:HEAT repeat domain-containing protein [Gemmatimonadota bacterium]
MKNAIRIWFRSMTDVRGGERVPVGLMLGYGFLALASYYIVKSVRSAVFIERVGSDMLSYVYMLTAVFVAVLMVVYSRYADRIRERALLLGTFVLLGTSLVFLWWMLRDDAGGWVAWTLYIFSKLYPLLLVSQFWLVANLLFTTRQAKRLFGIIGLALILGGIAGAEVASRLADVVGTRTLLLLAVTPLPFCALIVLGLGSRLEQGRTASARLLREFSGDAVKLLVRSPHLRNISAVLALTILVGTLLDWQLGRAVDLYVSSEDAMAGFYGSFYRTLNIVSVGVQLFFTSFVLRRFGVGVALLALPLALFGASIAVIAVPALITASFAKGAEGALRYSLDQSTREMLFLPVPNETLYKVKPLIDLAVYRGATGVGGLLLILATNILGFGLRGVGVICLVLIVAWVVVAVRMRHRYGDALAQSFERRVASAGTVFASVMNAESRPFVRQALADGNTLHAAFALDLLDQSGPEDLRGLTDAVHGVLSHEEPRIREHALKVLGSAEGADLELVRECLADPDAGVRVAAATALLSLAGPRRDSVMGELLGSPDAPVRVAALEALAATRNGNVPEVVVDRFFEELARSESTLTTAERRELAMAAGLVGGRSLARDVAHGLARDPDRAVASAALRSLGLIGDAGSTRLLIEGLGRSGTRAVAREALVTSSADVVPALVD